MHAGTINLEVRALAERDDVSWTISANGRRIGSHRPTTSPVIELRGKCADPKSLRTGERSPCIEVLRGLLTIAEFAVVGGRVTVASIDAQAGIEGASERNQRPDVVLLLTLDASSGTRAEVSASLQRIRGHLRQVSAREETWSSTATRGDCRPAQVLRLERQSNLLAAAPAPAAGNEPTVASGHGKFVAPIRVLERSVSGVVTRTRYVYCPMGLGTVLLDGCIGCPRLLDERAGHITCAIDHADPVHSLDTAVGRVVRGNVLCVTAGMSVRDVRATLAGAEAHLAVVVDGARYAGVVDTGRLQPSARNLEEELDYAARDRAPVARVARDVPPVVETTSIAAVARTMARRGARRLPVVDVQGNVVGVVDDLTLLRAIAPPHTRDA